MRLLLVGLNCTLHTLALLSMQATALSSAMLQSLTVPSSLPLRNLVGSVYSSSGQQLANIMQVRAKEVGRNYWGASGETVAAQNQPLFHQTHQPQTLKLHQTAAQRQHDSPSMPAFVQC